MDFSPNNT
jgi:hypothetical protein